MAYRPFSLEITDGTDTVDLTHGADGFLVQEWIPGVPQYKGGGVFQDSPLVDGRQLISNAFTTITDSFTLTVQARSPDAAIRNKQELRRILEKAAAYGTDEWNETPVYLIARGVGETETRYAKIVQGTVPDGSNPYGPEFNYFWSGGLSTETITVVIEHELWTQNAPGTGTTVCIGNGNVYNQRTFGPDYAGSAADLSNIFFFDDSAGTFSANLNVVSTTLMAAGSVQDDALYFQLPNNNITTLYFVLSSGQNGTADTKWEYWDGSAWTDMASLIRKDTTLSSGAGSLEVSGFVNFSPLPGWVETTVNSVNAYWIRMRLNGTPTIGNITLGNDLVSGFGPTCDATYRPYVANKRNEANLTHLFYYDSSAATYSSNLLDSPLPYAIDAGSAATKTNDILYFGIQSSLTDSGPFSNLIFNLSSDFAAASYTAVWEYSTAGGFSALTVQDNTDAGSGPLSVAGQGGVFWEIPSNHAARAVNGVTAYWIRLRITAGTGVRLPDQEDLQIYSCTWPYIEVSGTRVGGDVPALIKMLLANRSTSETNLTTSPLAYTQRLIVGMRTVSRGSNFTAFLNAADEQNPSGLTVAGASGGTFVTRVQTPVGRIVQVNFTGTTTAYLVRCTFTMNSTLAPHFLGKYHVFLRVWQDGGSTGDIQAIVSVKVGSGGVNLNSKPDTPLADEEWDLLDLGELQCYAPTAPDQITWSVGVANSSATPDLYIYDLALIPVDEWAVDLDGMDDLQQAAGNGDSFVIDSIRQKRSKEVWVQNSSGQLQNNIPGRGPSPAISRNNSKHRYWFLAQNGDEHDYTITNDAILQVNQRYLGMRGNR